jgi:hypothetical protein
MHCWDIMKDEPRWQEVKHNKGSWQHPIDVGLDPFVDGSTSIHQGAEDTTSTGKRPMGRDASKSAGKKSATTSSSSVSTEFATNLQELSIGKMTQWKEDSDQRCSQDDQLIEIEKLKHEDQVRLDRKKLDLKRERLELQRLAEERERGRTELQRKVVECTQKKAEMQERAAEERILAIDIDSLTNPRLRAYYKKLQDAIMS